MQLAVTRAVMLSIVLVVAIAVRTVVVVVVGCTKSRPRQPLAALGCALLLAPRSLHP